MNSINFALYANSKVYAVGYAFFVSLMQNTYCFASVDTNLKGSTTPVYILCKHIQWELDQSWSICLPSQIDLMMCVCVGCVCRGMCVCVSLYVCVWCGVCVWCVRACVYHCMCVCVSLYVCVWCVCVCVWHQHLHTKPGACYQPFLLSPAVRPPEWENWPQPQGVQLWLSLPSVCDGMGHSKVGHWGFVRIFNCLGVEGVVGGWMWSGALTYVHALGIIFKVFVKCKILSIQTILSSYMHTRTLTNTHTPVRPNSGWSSYKIYFAKIAPGLVHTGVLQKCSNCACICAAALSCKVV